VCQNRAENASTIAILRRMTNDGTASEIVVDGWIRTASPVDGRQLEPVQANAPEELVGMVERARAAQEGWAALPFRERVQRLTRAARKMLERRDEVLQLLRDEAGKNAADALMSEVNGPLDQVKKWAKLIGKHGQTRKIPADPIVFPGKRVWVDLIPRGVVGVISPWNFPLGTFMRPVLPALLTGNTVVVKPSELTPRTAQWFFGILQEELPADVTQLAMGGADVGRALLDAGIDACSFTGSAAAGRAVAARCGEHLIPVCVEAGGNDAAIVLADCDLDRTLAGVSHWALQNAGQNCGAIERCYVDERIADEFVDRLSDAWSRLSTDLESPDVSVSPLTSQRQLATVEQQVDAAVAQGAVVRTGGKRFGPGHGYLPTILDQCTQEMDVVREETFGPVLPIVRVADVEQAVSLANDCDYGLGGSVWTTDLDRGVRIAQQLHTGMASVNNHAVSGALVSVPWTGVKSSGSGIHNSEFALMTYLRPRTCLVDRNKKPDPFWIPYGGELVAMGHRFARMQLGALREMFGLLGIVKRRVAAIRGFWARR